MGCKGAGTNTGQDLAPSGSCVRGLETKGASSCFMASRIATGHSDISCRSLFHLAFGALVRSSLGTAFHADLSA